MPCCNYSNLLSNRSSLLGPDIFHPPNGIFVVACSVVRELRAKDSYDLGGYFSITPKANQPTSIQGVMTHAAA